MDSLSRSDDATIIHRFKVENYSYTKDRGIGKFIESTPFNVGGYKWIISFYPDGYSQEYLDYMSVFIQVQSKLVKLTASGSFSLLDHTTGKASHTMKFESRIFTSCHSWGFVNFMKRDSFEASHYLREDSLTIICNITIIDEPISSSTAYPVPIPPSDIHERLGALLTSKNGADITIEVGGKTFQAHKFVLAASSPVFESEIFGWFKSEKKKIKIDDMEAPVFEAMLHFIYGNTLPEIEDHKILTMVPHLLEAADRYKLKRLKLACEQKLGNSLDIDIGDALALAEKYNLTHFKEYCINLLASPNAFSIAMDSEGFKQILMNHTDIVKDVMNRMIEKL